MWKNTYKDYKPDEKWIQESVSPRKGIIGCEMNELNGWGEKFHMPTKKKRKNLSLLLSLLFKRRG